MKNLKISWVAITWVAIGVALALHDHYGHQLDNASQVATFGLAVIFWPALALGGTVAVTF